MWKFIEAYLKYIWSTAYRVFELIVGGENLPHVRLLSIVVSLSGAVVSEYLYLTSDGEVRLLFILFAWVPGLLIGGFIGLNFAIVVMWFFAALVFITALALSIAPVVIVVILLHSVVLIKN